VLTCEIKHSKNGLFYVFEKNGSNAISDISERTKAKGTSENIYVAILGTVLA